MGSHSSSRDRKGSSRKGSSDSYRSQRSHRDRSRGYDSYRSRDRDRGYDYDDDYDEDDRRRGSKRKGTGSTSSSNSASRSNSNRDRDDTAKSKAQPFGNLLGTLSEEPETLGRRKLSKGSSPPTYDESQAQSSEDKHSDPEKGRTKNDKNKKTLTSWWSLAPVVPLLTGIFFLFVVTASSSELRADVGVVKIGLSAGDYPALYSATLSAAHGSSGNSTVAARSMDGRALMKRDDTGFLTLGIWGWCVRNADSSQ